jgi:O-antigen/teichoic acid export membrane protein
MKQAPRPVTGILQGSAIFFVASLLTFVARFATGAIVARSLGPDGKGIYVLVLTVGAILLILFSFGMNNALNYHTASHHFSDREIFSFSTYAALAGGVLAALLFYPAYLLWLADTFLAGVDPAYILLTLLLLPLNLWGGFLLNLLAGQQFLLQYNLVVLVQVTANLVFQLIAALLDMGLTGTILAWAASGLVGLVLTLWYTRHSFSLQPKALSTVLRPALQYGMKGYPGNLLTFFNYRLDTFLVNFFIGAGPVGLYTTSVSSAEVLYLAPNAISSALLPKVPRLSAESATELTCRLVRTMLLALIPGAILFGWIGIYLIPFIFGQAFQASTGAFLLLLPGILGIAVNKVLTADLGGRGKPVYATYTAVIALAITIVLDLVLIPRSGINGAAIASSVAYLASAALSIYWFCQLTGSSIGQVTLPTVADARLLLDKGQEYARLVLKPRK